MRVLVARQEVTGADRQWAEQYRPGDIVRYTKGSRTHGLAAGEYVRVAHVDAAHNLVTVRRQYGARVTYDPRRLQGVTLYRESDRAFATGDRVQVTAPDRAHQIANRELGTLEAIETGGSLRLRLDSGTRITVSAKAHPHLDYGYAVTSHSSRAASVNQLRRRSSRPCL